MVADKMLINGALERLISGEEEGWLESAQIVVDFGRTILPSGPVMETRRNFIEGGKKDKMTGYAAGIGNVSIHDKEKNSIDAQHRGFTPERVGYYKMIHRKDGRWIQFWQYQDDLVWKNPQDDETGPPLMYFLLYNEKGDPHTFATSLWKKVALPIQDALRIWVVRWLYKLKYFIEHQKLLRLQRSRAGRYRGCGFTIVLSTKYQKNQIVDYPQ